MWFSYKSKSQECFSQPRTYIGLPFSSLGAQLPALPTPGSPSRGTDPRGLPDQGVGPSSAFCWARCLSQAPALGPSRPTQPVPPASPGSQRFNY